MNALAIVAVIVGLVIIAGSVLVVANGGIDTESSSVSSCSSCQGKCSADSNCGLATCGALQGKPCSCGK